MMGVAAVEQFEVKVGGGVIGEGAQELFEQRVWKMVLRDGCWGAEVDEGATAEIDDGAGECFVHGNVSVSVSSDAFSVAEGFGEGLSEGNSGVFDGVMKVDFDIAVCFDGEIGEAVFSEQGEHVVQKRDSGGYLGVARAIDLEGEGDAGFCGVTLDFSGAGHCG